MEFKGKLTFSVAIALLLAAAFTVFALAAEGEAEEIVYPTEGYVYMAEGKETNIKWTIYTENEEIICRFEIDKNATDKEQATVVTACNAEGRNAGWSSNSIVPWYYGGKINKMIFGEGITGATGGVYMVISSLKTIEVSKDFKSTGFATFEADSGLSAFTVTGSEYKNGIGDFTYMTSLGSYCFDGAKFSDIILGENVKSIPAECFKANKFSEINFPATLESISDKAFSSNMSLKKVTFNNPDTGINATAFDGCVQLFTFVGYKGSTAEEFAIAGGYEFVDIETGEVIIEGTREVEKDPNEIMAQYPLEKADASGRIEQLYNDYPIVNTYWAYFKDSKTLVFINNASGYNETGNQQSPSEDAQRYSEFKFETEHIIVGPGIHKISGGAFEGFVALKTVQVSGNLQQIDAKAFHNCTSLTTVYKLGKNPVEGMAELSFLGECQSSILKNTAIETVKLSATIAHDRINPIAFIGCKNIIGAFSDEMKEYAKANMFNLINIENESEIYECWQYVNPDTVSCGPASIASFDEETGTLTILGSGELYDIVNYYGGGSKQVPWFKYRNQIKKVIVGPRITYIGKYIFCQCVNLQEVELSGSEIEIGAGAFEKCYNLRSVYTTGNEPIIGTFDLRTVKNHEAWTFAYNYLAVNVIIGEHITDIGGRFLEDCMNVDAIYGVTGSYAQIYASENGYNFCDISAGLPAAKLGTPPAMNEDEKQLAEMDSNKDDEPEETELTKYCIIVDNHPNGAQSVETVIVTGEETPSGNGASEDDGNASPIIFIAIAAVIVAAAAATAVIVIKNKGKEKK